MLFSIIAQDTPNSLDKRIQARPDHVARLQALQQAGQLVLAGPFPAIETTEPGDAGFTGSLIVAEFASLAQAQAWAEADPYMASGAYQTVSVKPFKKVFPQ